MHNEIIEWMSYVKRIMPQYFSNIKVLDVGSRNVNGTNRYLYDSTVRYEGLDITPGDNVDHVGYVHEWTTTDKYYTYDSVISTDMLEHDRNWLKSIQAMLYLLKPGGLLVLTCAGEGRAEHGTSTHNPEASIGTNDYYQNLTPLMMREAFLPELTCSTWQYNVSTNTLGPGYDTRFFGVKLKG